MHGLGGGHFHLPHFVHREPVTRQAVVLTHQQGPGGAKSRGMDALSVTELRFVTGIAIAIILAVLYSVVT